MDIAKSFFGNRPHEGYAGREDYNVSLEVFLEKRQMCLMRDSLFPHICYCFRVFVIHVAEYRSCVKTPCFCISEYWTIFNYTLLPSHLFLKLHYSFYFFVINVVFLILAFEFNLIYLHPQSLTGVHITQNRMLTSKQKQCKNHS